MKKNKLIEKEILEIIKESNFPFISHRKEQKIEQNIYGEYIWSEVISKNECPTLFGRHRQYLTRHKDMGTHKCRQARRYKHKKYTH